MTSLASCRRELRLGTLVCLVLLAASLLVVSLPAAPASAHATLQEATPSDRSVLNEAPGQVTLRFNEPVTLPTGGLRVFDAEASRIDDGTVSSGDADTVAVALPDDLPDGGYVVTWRVISADSHPVSGVFTFTVGEAPEIDDALIAELFAGDDGLIGAVGQALRAVAYAAVLLAVGALYLVVTVSRRGEDRRRARTLAWYGAIVGIFATLAAVPVQAMAVTGEGIGAVFRTAVLGEVVASSFGQGTLVRFVWLVALLLFVARRAPMAANLVAGTAALLSFVLDGHQRSAEPTWLLMVADAIHLGAAALWFGGLVLLAWLVRTRSLDHDPVGAARVVARFSNAALLSVIAVAAAGGAMTWALVRVPRALTTTTYGWLLVAKVAVVVLIVLVALYNRARLVPAIAARAREEVTVGDGGDAPGETAARVGEGAAGDGAARVGEGAAGDGAAGTGGGAAVAVEPPADTPIRRRSRAAWKQLRSTLVIEAALIVVVLGITGVLVTTQPAAEVAGVTGAAQVVTPLTDELEVEVIIDPNEVGINAIHVYVLDATGRPAAEIDDLALELTYLPEDIGPFRVEPFFVGTGHWTANVDTLRFAGEWRIDVVAGLDRFTEAEATTTIVVNR